MLTGLLTRYSERTLKHKEDEHGQHIEGSLYICVAADKVHVPSSLELDDEELQALQKIQARLASHTRERPF